MPSPAAPSPTFNSINANASKFSYAPDGHGGVNYFFNSTPVTNTAYGLATGQDTGSIERSALDAYNASKAAPAAGAVSSGSVAPSGTGVSQSTIADAVNQYQDQINQLNALLGRTNTALDQGLTKNTDEYNRNVASAQSDADKQYANYDSQVQNQNQSKQSEMDKVRSNAYNGYKSLAQIIGRAAGTGSSAFQELLPDVIGKDTSTKSQDISTTVGTNLANIQKARDQYGLDFQGVLDDLTRQRNDNESSLRSGIETQRQGLNSQIATAAAQKVAAGGGGYAAQKAAAAPYQAAIDNSRNAVEGLFNQFFTPFQSKQAVAATPDLSQFTTDRSTVNAQNSGLSDPTNPYTSLLLKRLQGGVQ